MLSGLGAQPNQEVKKYTAQRNLSWLYHFPQSPESHHIDDCHDCQREVILQKNPALGLTHNTAENQSNPLQTIVAHVSKSQAPALHTLTDKPDKVYVPTNN